MISRPVRHSLPSTESEPRSDLVHMQFTRKNLLPSSEVELVDKYSYHLNTFFKEASFATCIWRGFSPLSYILYILVLHGFCSAVHPRFSSLIRMYGYSSTLRRAVLLKVF